MKNNINFEKNHVLSNEDSNSYNLSDNNNIRSSKSDIIEDNDLNSNINNNSDNISNKKINKKHSKKRKKYKKNKSLFIKSIIKENDD